MCSSAPMTYSRSAISPGKPPAVAQRVRLEMDARTGEHNVEESQAHSYHQLQQLLGTGARGQGVAAGAATGQALQPPVPALPHPVPAATTPAQPTTRRPRIAR